MTEQMKKYYEKRAQVLVKNLKSRHFDAFYCPDAASALEKALELIPEGASVGWGGALSAQQIGPIDAVKNGNYAAIDRDAAKTPEERNALLKRCLTADVFLSGANALSLEEKWLTSTAREIVWQPLCMARRPFWSLQA